MSDTMMNKCYKCKHRGTIPGDCHSECRHPKAFFGGDGICGITAVSHGIEKGWFLWPINFDPVWLLSCNLFEAKEVSAVADAKISEKVNLKVDETQSSETVSSVE